MSPFTHPWGSWGSFFEQMGVELDGVQDLCKQYTLRYPFFASPHLKKAFKLSK